MTWRRLYGAIVRRFLLCVARLKSSLVQRQRKTYGSVRDVTRDVTRDAVMLPQTQ